MRARLERFGRRFARLATRVVVFRPALWRLFRLPLEKQFDSLAPEWEGRRGPEALLPLVAALDRLGRAPRRVLDVGTGTGKAARVVAKLYPDVEVVGVDLSEAMLQEARRLVPPDVGGRLRFERADGASLPFPDASFDLVVLLNAIPFFDEIGRVTTPGGAAVFAFSSGAATPIYVPPETLSARLRPLGYEEFEELAAGEGTALVARRPEAE